MFVVAKNMKKIALSLAAVLGLLGISVGSYAATSQILEPSTTPTARVNSVPASPSPIASVTPLPSSKPSALVIPKIGVNAVVEHVGLDAEKRMDVPKEWKNVAWFELGPVPGQLGSAVMAGHLDSPSGAAVFYSLDTLTQGDEIIVTNQDGTSLTFVVEKTATYSENQFPLQEVFENNDKKRLNLITCSGIFNKNTQLYSHRLVVFAVLNE